MRLSALTINVLLRQKYPNTELFLVRFPVIGLNTEIHFINCRSQSEYGEIWTRRTPYLDTFYTVYGTKNGILNSNLRQKQKS